MLLLRNSIMPNEWGEIDGIARLVGSEPTGGHEAELWVGTHPRGPSTVDSEGGSALGDVVGELPFLLKVLSIGDALSLQAHPSTEQAIRGFEREDAAGIAIDAPERNYRDDAAKPEMLVALETTWILCGFREPAAAAELVETLGVTALRPLVDALRSGTSTATADALGWLLRLADEERATVATAIAGAASSSDDLLDPVGWVARLAERHPGDPTAIAPLLLTLDRLDPGEAVHLAAGNLHAYLLGAGVELMATSDNVLRGGLTQKHVDVDELLAILDPEPGTPPAPDGRKVAPGCTVYDPGEEAFGLVRVDPALGPIVIEPTEHSLLLAVGGEVDLGGEDEGLTIGHGDAAYASVEDGPITVTGSGILWWATTRAGLPT